MLRFFLSIWLLVLLLPHPVMAQDVLRVPFSEHPPKKFIDSAGLPAGIDTELLKEVARRMHLHIHFVICPFKRGLYMMKHGEADLMTGVLRRADRDQYLYFLTPPTSEESHKAFFVLKGNEHNITRHEDLYNLNIGTGLGAKYYPRFDEDQRIRKEPLSTGHADMKMLLNSRVDAVIMTESAGDYRIATLGLQERVAKADYIYSKKQSVHFALSKSSPLASRLEEFNATLEAILAEDFLKHATEQFYRTIYQSTPAR